MARRARIMARRRRHIPPITDDNFHEEWNKFKMDLDASEDDIVYTFFAREQNSLLFLCRIWRLLVVREPPSDSDGERPRRINRVVQSPQHLWDVGCRIYMTAVPDVFRTWRTGNLSRASRTAAAIEVPSRPLCACRCGCRKRPSRRIQCPGCGQLVGPGCAPEPCWNQQTGACHVCTQGNPQENIGEAARAPHPGAAG